MVTYEFYTFAEYEKFISFLKYEFKEKIKSKFWDYFKYTETICLQKELTEKIKSQGTQLFLDLKESNKLHIEEIKDSIKKQQEKLEELEKVKEILDKNSNFEDAFNEIVHLM